MHTNLVRILSFAAVLALWTGPGTAAYAADNSGYAPKSSGTPAVKQDTAQDPSRTNAAADIKLEALWDGRKMVPFHTLDSPKMVPASEADFLDDSDYILGVSLNGESRAYPTRYIWFHHGINDTIGLQQAGGSVPILVTYCSVCNTGVCYDPTVNGKTLMLDFYGLYNGVATLCDRETQSVFLLADGRFATGTLMGTQLKPRTLLDTTWGEWKQLHPETLVMSPDSPYSKFYSPKSRPEPRGYDRFPAPFFRPSVTRGDLRLPPFDKVLGVAVEAPAGRNVAIADPSVPASLLRRAYPIKVLQQRGCVVNDRVGKTSIAVFLDPDTMTAVAVSRTLDGKTLKFETRKQADGKLAIFDRQTHSRWNIEGKAEEGPLAGKMLDPVENHLSQWYGWAAYFPETSVFGMRGGPKPGDPFPVSPPTPTQTTANTN